MTGTARPLALVLAAGTLMSVRPMPTYSAEVLAYLDPSARFASLCGGKSSGSMRVQLALAAAAIGGAGQAAAPPP